MTEVEAFELAAIWSANVLTCLSLYITFTFAYLATAFFVGRQLSTFQAVAASVLYLFAAGSMTIGLLADLQWLDAAIIHAGSLAPDGISTRSEFWVLYLGVLAISGILLSLYFMWDVRKTRAS